MVTPYSTSAASIVRFWCVTTMNCARSEKRREADEASDVRVVEGRLDLVQQIEGARPREEERKQERQRAERLLAAREEARDG